ncbi:glycosyltransferase family 4 protein [Phreatobacter sp.]|uniref:glycosyltransferase family 4 protein n=1 Tax=Phreatobacter sp. TaxID=1966341 RepID=UPI0022C85DD4|nr:glycosyltransferase family 4 protein [Phreatobacter sp.]MCZ8316255.1 glycosyltransferase family 4 protein [Phreatobacter sp.]
MITATFAIPGDLATPTGGYRYDREVLARASAHGVEFDHLPLPGSFPFPPQDDLLRTAGLLVSQPADRVVLVDGLAYGALPESICLSVKSPIVALVHHPLALESGLAADTAARLKASEAAALVHARRIVVTSRITGRILTEDYAVPADRITVAEPGTAPAPRATGSGRPEPTILTVGAISARKGYDVLVAALARLQGEAWRLIIAGATDRAPEVHAALREAIRHHGLEARVTLTGAISDAEIDALYAQADLFVMPSRYEGYGMVLAEAMARGLPIITTTGGAAAETVPDGAAVKVPPDDALALSAALSRLIQSPRMRADLAARSFEAGRTLPGWDDTARIVATVVAELATGTHSHSQHPGPPR